MLKYLKYFEDLKRLPFLIFNECFQLIPTLINRFIMLLVSIFFCENAKSVPELKTPISFSEMEIQNFSGFTDAAD